MKIQKDRPSRIDIETLRVEREAIKEAADAQNDALDAFAKGGTPGSAPSGAKAILAKEAANPASRIDWKKFPDLASLSPERYRAMRTEVNAMDRAEMALGHLIARLAGLETNVSLEALPDDRAREAYSRRIHLMELIQSVERALEAAAGSPAVARFPRAQLAVLAADVKEDLELLSARVREDRGLSLDRVRTFASSINPFARREPSLDQLPETRALSHEQVQTTPDAARALAERLGAPQLEASLVALAERIGAKRPALDLVASGLALLADEITTAPDYTQGTRSWGPDHRQTYRARKHSRYTDSGRQERSGEALKDALQTALAAKSPLKALEKVLVDRFTAEVGVPEPVSKAWKGTAQAVHSALSGEAFVPLRALNERSYAWGMVHGAGGQAREVAREITAAVVEGRYEAWRLGNPASERQLSILNAAQRDTWLEPMSVEVEIRDRKGNSVVLQTSEPQASDFGIFWSTKVGGPSHGFDTMTHCALSLLTNARNQTIVAKDPRWQNFAGRTYLRLLAQEHNGKPIVFCEGAASDFPYPGERSPVESAIIRHAIHKAKAMGVPLALSGSARAAVEEMELPGEWRNESYRLEPAVLFEAASVFGPHDMVQTEVQVRRMVKPQFYVNLDALD